MKNVITGAIVALMLAGCARLDMYTETVTATERTITGRTTAGEAVTLTECRTDEGGRVLLEGVEPGKVYRVTLDSCGTWSREDDNIVRIKEVKR